MARKAQNPAQGELPFHEAVYPARLPQGLDGAALASKVARAMSAALKQCGGDRYEVAAKIAAELGRPTFSKAVLDKYTAESSETHNVSFVVLVAFVRATGCGWLWDFLLKDEGYTVLQGKEARLAELGRVEQQLEELAQYRRRLRADPVAIVRRPTE